MHEIIQLILICSADSIVLKIINGCVNVTHYKMCNNLLIFSKFLWKFNVLPNFF